jgi:hypothetical protein
MRETCRDTQYTVEERLGGLELRVGLLATTVECIKFGLILVAIGVACLMFGGCS